MADFSDRLELVRARIEAACGRAGRKSSDVLLVAVAKTFGPESVMEAAESGITVFGESRIQEAKQKMPQCPGNIEWHMIGHLQSNKCRDAVRMFRMIHSVDSLKLLEFVDRESHAAGVEMPVCLEVNVSGEGSKFGLKPDGVPVLLDRARTLMNVDIVGLMTIPPFMPEPEGARKYFVKLRETRDWLKAESGFDLSHLSMGMSHDFDVAIEEGATMIRLGSILFGKRGE